MSSSNPSRSDRVFHETWLGMVQPTEGLLVSIPVLVDAQCIQRHGPELQRTFLSVCKGGTGDVPLYISDLPGFMSEMFGLHGQHFDADEALPADLSLYVPEGKQRIAPTMALKKRRAPEDSDEEADSTPASRVGRNYELLIWNLPQGLPLDKPETLTGPWDYPPSAKFDRLLRQCRVPIGMLHNGECLRLVYAPHGESSGSITFRVTDMAEVGGRPILDAMVMLLHGRRIFGAQEGRKLLDLLVESRVRQANVTNKLAEQVFDALRLLLDGFEAAAERDGSSILREALERDGRLDEDNHVYAGLLTVLLRLVFVLYAEDRSLLPVESKHYERHMSLLALFEQLQDDAGAFPDSMHQRYGAWGRLLSLFRAIYFGVQHGDMHMPARQGDLFDPERFPFLEGWSGIGAPPVGAEERAEVRPPSIDDGTLHAMLERLLILDGQRLSYQTLDVEQIGSVYEALMGYHVVRLTSPAACLRPNKVWVSVEDVQQHAVGARGAKWLTDTTGLAKAAAGKLGKKMSAAAKKGEGAIFEALEGATVKGTYGVEAGKLVLQPGEERRRTSSHYTPRSLSAPIVKKTLDPLIHAMGDEPPSERILRLVICDPAMGSGAFLVEACRYLADQLIAAWTRENVLDKICDAHEDVVNHARRLVAQRCLYGVDKNPYAVSLAKLSLWLVTLARSEPFTFVDHSLRHGDSLVGLSFEQITAFHWAPKEQVETCERELREVLDEAVHLRQQILELASDASPEAQREKQRLLWDAEDALNRIRLIGDLVVGAFLSAGKAKAREAERSRRLAAVASWLTKGGAPPDYLQKMQAEVREKIPVFHWMVEFPEVFWADRPDPLAKDDVNHAAFVEAFVGNPPFMGVASIADALGQEYVPWLQMIHPGTIGKFDLAAHFFRRADSLLGTHGTLGFIATNTIGQGDTRATGLKHLLARGYRVADANRDLPWPGAAAVTVCTVHLAAGAPGADAQPILDGVPREFINSRLRPGPERSDPVSLSCNADLSFVGCIILGMGFTFCDKRSEATPLSQMEELVRGNRHNASRILPYLGGEEINSHPSQLHRRYVISFDQLELSEAEAWPDLLEIVRERVKPERASKKRKAYRERWWLFAEPQTAMRKAIGQLSRCLVIARVSKHLCVCFQPTDRIFSEQVCVFPLDSYTALAILQSRVHEQWARLLSSSMKTDLRYSVSDCFENFPFPQTDPRAVVPDLEAIGQKLDGTRARFMVETDQGLTKTYNALKDADCDNPRILELRDLQEQVDTTVLAAYGWSDIEVPPFCIADEADEKALRNFEDEVLERLFILNEQRVAEEAAGGKQGGSGAGGTSTKRGRKKKAPPKGAGDQGNLGF